MAIYEFFERRVRAGNPMKIADKIVADTYAARENLLNVYRQSDSERRERIATMQEMLRTIEVDVSFKVENNEPNAGLFLTRFSAAMESVKPLDLGKGT